jgi:hypothetical protein
VRVLVGEASDRPGCGSRSPSMQSDGQDAWRARVESGLPNGSQLHQLGQDVGCCAGVAWLGSLRAPTRAGVLYADLSAYNLLWWEGLVEAVFIDWMDRGPRLVIEQPTALALDSFSQDASSVGVDAYDARAGRGERDHITTDLQVGAIA